MQKYEIVGTVLVSSKLTHAVGERVVLETRRAKSPGNALRNAQKAHGKTFRLWKVRVLP